MELFISTALRILNVFIILIGNDARSKEYFIFFSLAITSFETVSLEQKQKKRYGSGLENFTRTRKKLLR